MRNFDKIIVCPIGGVTFDEIREIRRIAKEYQREVGIMYGMVKIIFL
jgi:hypothetical protein